MMNETLAESERGLGTNAKEEVGRSPRLRVNTFLISFCRLVIGPGAPAVRYIGSFETAGLKVVRMRIKGQPIEFCIS